MADPCPRRSESMRRPMMSTASSNSGHLAGMLRVASCGLPRSRPSVDQRFDGWLLPRRLTGSLAPANSAFQGFGSSDRLGNRCPSWSPSQPVRSTSPTSLESGVGSDPNPSNWLPYRPPLAKVLGKFGATPNRSADPIGYVHDPVMMTGALTQPN
jgi:hypothetical protein